MFSSIRVMIIGTCTGIYVETIKTYFFIETVADPGFDLRGGVVLVNGGKGGRIM